MLDIVLGPRPVMQPYFTWVGIFPYFVFCMKVETLERHTVEQRYFVVIGRHDGMGHSCTLDIFYGKGSLMALISGIDHRGRLGSV